MISQADMILESNIKNNINTLFEKVKTSVPAIGAFKDISVLFENFHPDYPGDVELTVGAWVKPAGDSSDRGWRGKRYFEVRVYSENKESDSSQWIYNGSKEEILSYMEDEASIEDIITAVREGVENLRRHFMY